MRLWDGEARRSNTEKVRTVRIMMRGDFLEEGCMQGRRMDTEKMWTEEPTRGWLLMMMQWHYTWMENSCKGPVWKVRCCLVTVCADSWDCVWNVRLTLIGQICHTGRPRHRLRTYFAGSIPRPPLLPRNRTKSDVPFSSSIFLKVRTTSFHTSYPLCTQTTSLTFNSTLHFITYLYIFLHNGLRWS